MIVVRGMSLYFIHFTGASDSYPDLEGVELADDAAARDYAVEDARYLMREGFAAPADWPLWRVEVVDETGRRLLALAFSDLAESHGRVH